ncbi:MAG TPA: hypothetical protein VFO62_03855 [Candidatus Binatia bacterium]|nr:hypothetical protein [Candidatus Binatia bacterium]
MTKEAIKFLTKIVEDPGILAADLPRAKRGETIKFLELNGFIHYGPGGWFPTDAGIAEIQRRQLEAQP